MKRNNIIVGILFAFNLLCFVVYIFYKLFLPEYTLFFPGMDIFAAVLFSVMMILFLLLLFNKDRQLSKTHQVLLCVTVAVLIPLNKLFVALIIYGADYFESGWQAVIFILLLITAGVTVALYNSPTWLKAFALIAFIPLISLTAFYNVGLAMFTPTNAREIEFIDSPDGTHSVVITDYTDPGSIAERRDAHVYDAAGSLKAGSISLRKNWKYLSRVESPFEDDSIIWLSDSQVKVDSRIYNCDGERVTEPPEPPL